ncbi:hypothetical protein QOZ80_5AG0367920 [Eleusine coracana subsp. coracana]|nr:hypothetical protein QOZ80_5AG0367920 [Eleusine coracana subsp. coracana]
MGNCSGSASREAASWTTDGSEPVPLPGQEEENGEVRTAVEVTITISERRLQELLVAKAAAGVETMTAEKVLVEILRASEAVDLHRLRRRWEPELQSIPEAVES